LDILSEVLDNIQELLFKIRKFKKNILFKFDKDIIFDKNLKKLLYKNKGIKLTKKRKIFFYYL